MSRQPWDTALRARAKELLDNASWVDLYSYRTFADGQGAALGSLMSCAGAWRVYTPGGKQVSESTQQPQIKQVLTSLRDARMQDAQAAGVTPSQLSSQQARSSRGVDVYKPTAIVPILYLISSAITYAFFYTYLSGASGVMQ